MMYKMFVLDDDADRMAYIIHILSREFPGCTIASASTLNSAKRMLQEDIFDVLFLDHDLGGMIYVPSENPDTGYQLAFHIWSNNIPYKKCIVHSLNYEGSMNILGRLRDCIWLPVTAWTPQNLEFVLRDVK